MTSRLPQRITVFSTDFPYPANKGGRADVWRRMQALKQLGVGVQLVCFYDDLPGKRPSADERAAVLQVASSLHAYPIRKGLLATVRRLSQIHRLPWHAACRTLNLKDQRLLEQDIQHFDPTCLWCEGPWCGLNAQRAAARLNKPLIYRSHNVEHLYMRRQAGAARSRRDRIAWTVACFGLERFESAALESAAWVFDISGDDMVFWQNRGRDRISWLPPIAEAALLEPALGVTSTASSDVVFLGNLTTPNNIRGVEWLITKIAPIVLKSRPETCFVIAGSNPGEHVRTLCQTPSVTLIANPADALAIYRSGRVLVNPVRTGSGTQVKAIEMLMTDAPIVTATQGTAGLPDHVKRLFRVADSAEAFAEQILIALNKPKEYNTERAEARRLFGIDGLADALYGLGYQKAFPV
jgi:glycosyltransferase involved in cell wall biosynthesis